MARVVSYELRGADLLSKQLNKLSSRAEDEIRLTMIDIGHEIVGDARMRLTTEGHVVTGRLRSSIHLEYDTMTHYTYSDINGNSYDGSLGESLKKLEILIGSNVVYARRIERLYPHIYPAYITKKRELMEEIKAIIKELS